MKQLCTGLLATLMAVLLVGCSQHPQATQAILSSEDALVQIRDMAQTYAPDQLHAVDEQLNALRDSLAKRDFKAVLAGAPALNTAISNLKAAASAKKQEAEEALARAKDAWARSAPRCRRWSTRSRAASTSCPSRITCPRASPRTAWRRRSPGWTP